MANVKISFKFEPILISRTILGVVLCMFNVHFWDYDQTELGHGFRQCVCGTQEELVPDYSRFHAFHASDLVPGGPRGIYEAKWQRVRP